MPAVVITNSEGRPGVQTTVDLLRGGTAPLDALEAGIRIVEADPSVRSVGLGGAPNILGEMECDAALMCGATLRTGAVGAVREYLHVISVARQVMERLPHVMLAGAGAARFAGEIGERKVDLLSDEARADYGQWFRDQLPETLRDRWPDVPLAELVGRATGAVTPRGTTTFMARTAEGRWAGGVSTSGWPNKYPGRLGDSPVIGAGLYVDDRYGAAACTQTGEMTIRAGTARAVIAYMKKGAPVFEACMEAAADLHALKGGFLSSVIIHAADRDGDHCVTGIDLKRPATYWFWEEGMEKAEQRPVRPAE